MTTLTTSCCIAGGGPAGMMLGLLLARAGVPVVVLEKHADFLRDFRGDTIHPSTLELMHELGVLEQCLALPHQKTYHLNALFGERRLRIADFSRLPVRAPYIAFMPQWDFLDFLARHARQYPHFELRMQAEVDDVLIEQGRVCGVRAATPDGPLAVRAELSVAADGRSSRVAALAGLAVEVLGAPMDVLWFRLSRSAADPDEPMGRISAGNIFIMINRTEHWQCGYVIPKGALAGVQAAGLPAFRAQVARYAPFAAARVGEIASWDGVKLLSVAVDRLRRWHRPGLLAIGDAAHAMSPIGGVGINLAIQDAVACANRLAAPLRARTVTDDDLAAVQARRAWPTVATQRLQLAIQQRVVRAVLAGREDFAPPFAVRLLSAIPLLQGLTARLVGLGVRPEHVRSPVLAAER